MTTPTELRALAERVMALQGPCRETDAEIALAVHGGEIVWKAGNGTMEMHPARKYASAAHVGRFGYAPVDAPTTSLDAAVSLVPAGWAYSIHGGDHSGVATAYIVPDGGKIPWPSWVDDVNAHTPALALTAAALLARAQMMESEQ